MVAQTDIKYYVHTNHKAPQLENAYGSMLNVLDACLVNGFGSQTVDSLTANGTTVTADFGKAHNLLRFQVIKIDGAIQDEFNGEHRILEVTGNTITFEIATPATVERASGLINCSLPPLGWEKPFASENPNGGGKGAYRSKNTLLPNRPFLRVVDELDPSYNADWAKYAKVGMVEDMLDIDTMMGQQVPFDVNNPQKNWVGDSTGNGWAKWFYATSTNEINSIIIKSNVSDGLRGWIIIGCQDWFYIFNRTHYQQDTYKHYFLSCFFGFVDDDYLKSTILSAILVNKLDTWVTVENKSIFYETDSAAYTRILSNRSIHDNYETIFTFTPFSRLIGYYPHETFGVPSGKVPIVSSELSLIDYKNKIPRGKLPSVERIYQYQAYNHLDAIVIDNDMYLAVRCFINSTLGLVLFNLGAGT